MDINKINGFADWSLNGFNISYDKIVINLDCDGNCAIITCNNYIGLTFIGHWDENIIDNVEITERGDLIKDSLKNVKRFYGNNPCLGGGVKKFDQQWYQLNIKLIDGNIIKIACENFELK